MLSNENRKDAKLTMDIEKIEKLVQLVSDSKLSGFELEEGDMKITLKKEVIAQEKAVTLVQDNGMVSQNMSEKTDNTEVDATSINADEVITAPLVGTFYSSPSEGSEPFVKVGDKVKKGQVIGIIEAMKLMNEIESEFDGTVAAVLAENGQIIEYAQPLFRIAK